MPSLDIVDHSASNGIVAAPLSNASNLILIDNYDSFTWNVYQYLVLEGASVTVFRNDQISLKDLTALKPTQLVVSPGPGHPETDSGISRAAIEHFTGLIPVLGVCMGEQCIISAFGGEVVFAGEILHGKTSPLKHDGAGLYKGLPQDIPVTRYHSLAGTHLSLPNCLEVSSWSETGRGSSDRIIMGVRHKEYVVEGVQFHPESILTAQGRSMIKNFLAMKGGTWKENNRSDTAATNGGEVKSESQLASPNPKPSAGIEKGTEILDKIFAHRRMLVNNQKTVPSQRPSDLQAAWELGLAPPLVSFVDRLRRSPYALSLMAEIKRASPSKGIISLDTCAPQQGRTYALAGASVISVLTEPHWFKGSIDDLQAVRQSISGMFNRPAVLRKDFIFDEYQILEARLAGADTILLIVKMLDTETLVRLYEYSKSLGMEPLVEVNTEAEMKVAVDIGSQVIGVNNRNLTNFKVDLETTSRLLALVPEGVMLCALSGISGPQDVVAYRENGVHAVLVGEALMKAKDTKKFVEDLLHIPKVDDSKTNRRQLLVKICGTRTVEAAKAAVECGADLVGMILVHGRRRCVSIEQAIEISHAVHTTPKNSRLETAKSALGLNALDFFEFASEQWIHNQNRALLVGVFQNQPLSYILEQQRRLNLDLVQLHGSEPLEWANLIPVPVIKSFGPNDPQIIVRGYHALPLIDSAEGGSGTSPDLRSTKQLLEADKGLRVLLAGGLNSNNIKESLSLFGESAASIIGVDVSSGVEEDGAQSLQKIKQFVLAAKEIRV